MSTSLTPPPFIENKDFFSMNLSKSETDQLISLANNLKKIHAVTTKNFDDFDQLMLEYLKIGLEVFEMKIGIVSEIKDTEYHVCNVVADDDDLVQVAFVKKHTGVAVVVNVTLG